MRITNQFTYFSPNTVYKLGRKAQAQSRPSVWQFVIVCIMLQIWDPELQSFTTDKVK